jgi:hypothetical protein
MNPGGWPESTWGVDGHIIGEAAGPPGRGDNGLGAVLGQGAGVPPGIGSVVRLVRDVVRRNRETAYYGEEFITRLLADVDAPTSAPRVPDVLGEKRAASDITDAPEGDVQEPAESANPAGTKAAKEERQKVKKVKRRKLKNGVWGRWIFGVLGTTGQLSQQEILAALVKTGVLMPRGPGDLKKQSDNLKQALYSLKGKGLVRPVGESRKHKWQWTGGALTLSRRSTTKSKATELAVGTEGAA